MTSGLGGRGDLRRSSFGSRPRGNNAVTDLKQQQQHVMAVQLLMFHLPVVSIMSNEQHPMKKLYGQSLKLLELTLFEKVMSK